MQSINQASSVLGNDTKCPQKIQPLSVSCRVFNG
jgi:hypothetical protein